MLVAIGAGLLAIDLVFIAVAKHAGSHRSGGPVAAWLAIQGAIALGSGALLGIRHRSWWLVALVAAVGAGALALTGLLTANTTPGSTDCPGTQPCDTAFAFGAVFIGAVAFLALGMAAAIGRALGGLTSRAGST